MADDPIHERAGSGYDPGAEGHELQGRALEPMIPLERAARALHDLAQQVCFIRDPLDVNVVHKRPRQRVAWEGLSDGDRRVYFDQARAVLMAIREPSKAMIDAYDQHDLALVESGWSAAIDVALAGEG